MESYPVESRMEPPEPASRRTVLSIVLAATLIVALVAAVVVHRSISGEFLAADGAYSRFPGETVEDPFSDDDEREAEVPYRHGEEYSFEFTLVNHSRWPTRILGFPASDGGLLRQTAVAVKDTPFVDDAGFRPFHPFTMASGESMVVRVRGRFEGCADFEPDSFAGLTAVAVRHRTLWATRTHFVDLPTGIQVPAPPPGDCPER